MKKKPAPFENSRADKMSDRREDSPADKRADKREAAEMKRMPPAPPPFKKKR